MKRVVIMAGGTGGHIFPALAIAMALRDKGYEILWLGTRGRLEEVLVPQYGFEIKYIDVVGLRGNGLKRLIKAPCMLMHALIQARSVLKQFKPDFVIGMGGYASGPGGMAAYLMGIKLYLHEQNAAAGLTNKILSKFAHMIFLGFDGAFKGKNVYTVGNPVRSEIIALNGHKDIDVESDTLKILVIGGSLGAKALNEIVPLALEGFDHRVSITHQCGRDNSDKVKELYKNTQCQVMVSDFITDMALAYKNSDVIICRAGALTVAEVALANLPAIFVPLPTAVDDHQRKNAMSLVQKEGARLILQQDLEPQKLHAMLQEFLEHKELLVQMSKKLEAMAITDSTYRIIEKIENGK